METRRSAAATAHLTLRYGAVHRALRAAAERRAERSARLAGVELSPYCVTDQQAALLLDLTDPAAVAPPSPSPAVPEPAAEEELRCRAAAEGITLPLDALVRAAGLDSFECDALLLCLAPALAPEHALLFGYLVDDLDQRRPTAELILTVLAPTPAERYARLPALGPYGRLRRFGLLVEEGAWDASGADLLRPLSVRPELPGFLLHGAGDPGLLAHDPGRVAPPCPPLLDGPTRERAGRLGTHLTSRPDGVVALWGLPEGGRYDAAWAVAEEAGLTLRQADTDLDCCPTPDAVRAGLGRSLGAAAALGTALWLSTDPFHAPEAQWAAAVVTDLLARSGVPVVLTGRTPWRPLPLLATGRYAEETAAEPGYRERRESWSAATAGAGIAPSVLDDLAARFRLPPGQLRSAVRFAGSGGLPLEAAVPRVLASAPGRSAEVRTPARSTEDLVLPGEQARQIAELAAAFRAWPRVSQEWGFGGRHGGPGLKALFTGEPGTGKTLAAEVVAGTLGVDLIRVDLARTVSKWVGETEKNLDEAFTHAEAAGALLLFDEADAVFGRRGTVQRGTDRYANMEVGYLLQRLERSPALVVLTTNLQGNLDEAFTRRFQFVVHFTRP
ncbi:ATP-binding protein, partial [Streptomyces sp. NPDC002920]